MDKHGIDVSVVRFVKLLHHCVYPPLTSKYCRSSANPWLDFLSASMAGSLASELNDDLEHYCSTSPIIAESRVKRLYGFGLLPLVPEVAISSLLEAVQQISSLPHLKGVIMGTRGIGKGLDDDTLDPMWEAIEKAGLVVFLHPHYGVDGKAWGEKDNGHVLPLALGFPFETTIVSSLHIQGTKSCLTLLSFSGNHTSYSIGSL